MLTKIVLSKNLDIIKSNIKTQQFKVTLFCNGLMYIWQNKDGVGIIFLTLRMRLLRIESNKL